MHRDPYDMERFLRAQEGVYERALKELRNGRKETHWMWFIFPQLAELGQSAMAREYGIRSREEAAAFHQHAILGSRLLECASALLRRKGDDAYSILGSPDDLKLRSCMTLFSEVAPSEARFIEVLEAFHGGKRDEATLLALANL